MQELETAELPVVLKLAKSPAQEVLSVPHHLPKSIREMLHYLEQRKHNAKFKWAVLLFLLAPFLPIQCSLAPPHPKNYMASKDLTMVETVLIPWVPLASLSPHLPLMIPDLWAIILTLL